MAVAADGGLSRTVKGSQEEFRHTGSVVVSGCQKTGGNRGERGVWGVPSPSAGAVPTQLPGQPTRRRPHPVSPTFLVRFPNPKMAKSKRNVCQTFCFVFQISICDLVRVMRRVDGMRGRMGDWSEPRTPSDQHQPQATADSSHTHGNHCSAADAHSAVHHHHVTSPSNCPQTPKAAIRRGRYVGRWAG